MRKLLIVPILSLAACNPSAQQPAPAEKAVASETATASATASSTANYKCDNGKSVTAVYNQTDEKSSKEGATTASNSSAATVTIDGKPYTLESAVSASGARYSGKEGPTKGNFFTWWEKDDALWLEGPVAKFGNLEAEDVVATCKKA